MFHPAKKKKPFKIHVIVILAWKGETGQIINSYNIPNLLY